VTDAAVVDPWGPRPGERWSSGPWTAELRDDELADLRHGGVLVARSVRAVVRDRDWGTARATVEATERAGGVTRLLLRVAGDGVAAEGELRLEAHDDALTVALRLTATADSLTARTGLVLLHPPTVAGTPLRVRHGDGTAEQGSFPRAIAPHQPALDVVGLDWSAGGLDLRATFVGDVFEMEDQRNWTDASFKTYSRPLSRPFPYRLARGEVVEQAITLTASGTSTTPRTPREADRVVLVDAGWSVPEVGVGAATGPTSPGAHPAPPASTLLVELDAADGDPAPRLARAASSGLPLDVRVVASTPEDVESLVVAAGRHRPVRLGVASSTTHVSEPPLWEALVAAAREHAPAAVLLGGARSHFTELDREHARLPRPHAWTFAVTPQMHADGTHQLEESIGVQRLVTEQAVEIAGGAPVHVGPVTLRPRFNAVATTPTDGPAGGPDRGWGPALLDGVDDERQRSPRLGAWLVASAAALAEGGAASASWFEEHGPRGLEDDDGTAFPVRAAVAAVQAMSGLPLLVPTGPTPVDARTWVLAARTPTGVRALVARLGTTSAPCTLVVDDHETTVTLRPGRWVELHLTTTQES